MVFFVPAHDCQKYLPGKDVKPSSSAVVGRILLSALLVALFTVTFMVHAATFPANQCAANRKGSNLGCTANDVSITGMSVIGDTTSCVAVLILPWISR